jgi:tetratricopeptide (TPR) repeat protein
VGLFYRKSINLGGGFRVNLSKSGVGFSAGVKGARVSVGPGGAYLNAGRGPLRYRTKLTSYSNNAMAGSSNSSIVSTDPYRMQRLYVKRPSLDKILAVIGMVSLIFNSVVGFIFLFVALGVNQYSSKLKGYRIYQRALKIPDNMLRIETLKTAYALYKHLGIYLQIVDLALEMEFYEKALHGILYLANEVPHPGIRVKAAICLLALNRFDEALQYLPEIDEYDEPEQKMALLNAKAQCYRGLKRYDMALEIIKIGLDKRGEDYIEGKRALKFEEILIYRDMAEDKVMKQKLSKLLRQCPNYEPALEFLDSLNENGNEIEEISDGAVIEIEE